MLPDFYSSVTGSYSFLLFKDKDLRNSFASSRDIALRIPSGSCMITPLSLSILYRALRTSLSGLQTEGCLQGFRIVAISALKASEVRCISLRSSVNSFIFRFLKKINRYIGLQTNFCRNCYKFDRHPDLLTR